MTSRRGRKAESKVDAVPIEESLILDTDFAPGNTFADHLKLLEDDGASGSPCESQRKIFRQWRRSGSRRSAFGFGGW